MNRIRPASSSTSSVTVTPRTEPLFDWTRPAIPCTSPNVVIITKDTSSLPALGGLESLVVYDADHLHEFIMAAAPIVKELQVASGTLPPGVVFPELWSLMAHPSGLNSSLLGEIAPSLLMFTLTEGEPSTEVLDISISSKTVCILDINYSSPIGMLDTSCCDNLQVVRMNPATVNHFHTEEKEKMIFYFDFPDSQSRERCAALLLHHLLEASGYVCNVQILCQSLDQYEETTRMIEDCKLLLEKKEYGDWSADCYVDGGAMPDRVEAIYL